MLGFREVVVVDFEFTTPIGEPPVPVCLVAHEIVSGRKLRLFGEELYRADTAPYPTDSDTLFVAYYASAELGCHLALNWSLPCRVLDLYPEFRNVTNGRDPPCGNGLLGAMVFYGVDATSIAEKEAMRHLALRGGPWTSEEVRSLLAYCESDVIGLSRLFYRMLPKLDLPRALVRGRYMIAAAQMERCGVPIDTRALAALRADWDAIKLKLIARIDTQGIYDGDTFKANRWASWVADRGLPWPYLPSGRLDLSDETFHLMARRYPAVVEPYRQLRVLLSQMRLEDLTIGADGRNRCLLSAYRSITGRNQPSNTKFIFGPAVWLRSLIQPPRDHTIAYIDWCQQEFGTAAYLSHDPAMIEAYKSGDPYLAFAKQAGAAPPEATRESHSIIREQFKQCVLGVQYAMGPDSLARRIGQPLAFARELLQMHRETYSQFWRWSDAAVDHGMLTGSLGTVFGWQIHTGPNTNPRALRNFPMQANGSEMLRLACCFATEIGIRVCAPVHDALLIEARSVDFDTALSTAQTAMAEASRIVLGGYALRTEARFFKYPDRFHDDRGQQMWNTVSEILSELGSGSLSSNCLSIYVPPNMVNIPNTTDTLNTPDTPNTPDTANTPDTPNTPNTPNTLNTTNSGRLD